LNQGLQRVGQMGVTCRVGTIDYSESGKSGRGRGSGVKSKGRRRGR
jgi:hypothetical protein